MCRKMKMLLGGLILSTGLVVATPVSYAAETQVNGEEDIELAYENIDNYYSTLSISGTEATCKCYVKSKETKSIKVTMKLQKHLSGEWKTLKEWTGSTTGKTYSLRYRQKTILKNYKKYAGKNPIHRIKF